MLDFKQSCILLNKPSGISSNDALKKVKKKLNQKKAGFSGTLDPLASGLLIIFFNKATKLCSAFINADKSYYALIKLGEISSTGDLDGEISATNYPIDIQNIDLKKIEKKFIGNISQVPPMYSALKHKGKRLYDYAREGIEIERPAREIYIHNIDLNVFDSEHLSLKVKCSKGTYIRTLAEQIGAELGCGALVAKLERTHIEDIDLSNSVKLEDFLLSSSEEICSKYLINVDLLVNNIPSCYLSSNNIEKVLNGNKVKINENTCEKIKIYDSNNVFIGMGEVNNNSELLPKKILV
jgi:tRNA pseudouridine55 synthase